MSRLLLRVATGCALLVSVRAVCAATSWEGAGVLPRATSLQMWKSPDKTGTAGNIYKLEWPATVKKTDGQWLLIGDVGSYSPAPFQAWVRKGDIVRVDDAQATFTKSLRSLESRKSQGGATGGGAGGDQEGPSPKSPVECYWLRGIYWEMQGDTVNAIADYEKALSYLQGRNANELMAGDIQLRLGRMWSQHALAIKDAHLTAADPIFKRVDTYFGQAKDHFKKQCPPQLHVSWGDALVDRYIATGDDASAQRAKQEYAAAAKLNDTWWVPSYGQGKALLAQVNHTWPEDVHGLPAASSPDAKMLQEAIQHFAQAIRLNPDAAEPYRDRADALRRLASAAAPAKSFTAGSQLPDAPPQLQVPATMDDEARLAILDQAFQSARRAYEMGRNREHKSLETKARVDIAIASAFYPNLGDPGAATPTLDHRTRIAVAYPLYQLAADSASSAANCSMVYDDMVRRFRLAMDAESDAALLAGYISGENQTAIKNVDSQMSRLEQEIDRDNQILATRRKSAAADKQAAVTLDAQQATLDGHKTEARKAVDACKRRPTHDQIANAVSKLSKTIADLAEFEKSKGFDRIDPNDLDVHLAQVQSRLDTDKVALAARADSAKAANEPVEEIKNHQAKFGQFKLMDNTKNAVSMAKQNPTPDNLRAAMAAMSKTTTELAAIEHTANLSMGSAAGGSGQWANRAAAAALPPTPEHDAAWKALVDEAQRLGGLDLPETTAPSRLLYTPLFLNSR